MVINFILTNAHIRRYSTATMVITYMCAGLCKALRTGEVLQTLHRVHKPALAEEYKENDAVLLACLHKTLSYWDHPKLSEEIKNALVHIF